MAANNEQLAICFVELLVERANRNGQALSHWAKLTPAWRRIFSETIAAFLDEVGYRAIDEMQIDTCGEEEQIRILCDRMTARQRLKNVPAAVCPLGCRIDRIEQEIEKLTKSRC
jgi:hypothetical protein